MTVDRDRADDAGTRLPAPVFRPWPPRPATLSSPACTSIRPCFVRLPPPASSGLAPSAASAPTASAPAGPPVAGRGDRQQPLSRAARPPRYARFVAALQSAGGALGPAPVPWDAAPGDDVQTRPPAGLAAAGGARPVAGGRASLMVIERGLRRLAVRRSALLIGAASAAALALIALFDPTGGQDRARPVGPPAEAGGLVRAPLTTDRYRPAAGPRDPSPPRPLLAASQPPSSSVEVGHPRRETPEPPSHAAPPGPPAAVVDPPVPATPGPSSDPAPPGPVAAAVDAASASKAGPPGDPAPAPASLAQLSAAVAPRPPRIEDTLESLAVDGKFAALAVRTGALTEPAPKDDDPLYDLAHRLQEKGEIAQATEAYRMAAEANPQHASTWYDWGYLLQQQGDEQGARAKYLMTLRFAPRHAFAHYNLGYILQKHGDYAHAIQHYRAAIAANPTFFWSWYNLGYIRQKQGQYRAALADYRKSIEVDPKHALSYENIATILRYHRTD